MSRKLIGRVEHIELPELGLGKIHSRVDTGARTSSIWASDIKLKNGVLSAKFFDETSKFYNGARVKFNEFDTTAVSTSTGHIQKRFKVRLLVKLKGKKIRAWFTLADRSTQVYPVLIGRNILMGKFIVDVKKGRVIKDKESLRRKILRSYLELLPEDA